MTDCPNVAMRELLPELLHDALPAAERARLEAHLATCEECAAELTLLRAVRRAMVGARTPALDTAAIVAALPRPVGRRPEVHHLGSHRPERVQVRRSPMFFRIAAAVTFVSLGGTSIAVARSYFGGSPTAIVDSAVTRETALEVSPPLASVDTPVTRSPGIAGLSVHTALGELNDAELESLMSELDQLEAAPLAEPEGTPGGRVVASTIDGS